MFSKHVKICDVADIRSDNCIVIFSSCSQPFISHTRYLTCKYAIKISVSCKIVYIISEITNESTISKTNTIYDLLSVYKRLIILDDTCCINSKMPNLFDQVGEDEFGGVLETNVNTISRDCQLIKTQLSQEMDTNTYLKSGLYIISRSHRCLFDPKFVNNYIKLLSSSNPHQVYINYVLHNNIMPIKIKLLDNQYNNYDLDRDINLRKKPRQLLNESYINENYLMNINSQYKYQLFYIKQICDIYNNSVYLNPVPHINFDFIDDVSHEIEAFKKIRKHKFKMLVFGLGHDSLLWYKLTQRKIFFMVGDGEESQHPDINENHIVRFSNLEVNVLNSFTIPYIDIIEHKIPIQIRNQTFDIIIINNPNSCQDYHPSLLLPIFWSSQYLANKDAVIYVCDSDRLLENFCIDKYFTVNKFSRSQFQSHITKIIRTK